MLLWFYAIYITDYYNIQISNTPQLFLVHFNNRHFFLVRRIYDNSRRRLKNDSLSFCFRAYDYTQMWAKYGNPRKKVKIILECSATQQQVINQSGIKLFDFSAITIVSAPFFRDVPYLVRLTSHNRRCSDGKLEDAAICFNFVDRMEKGLAISESLKTKFFDRKR